MKLHYAYNSRTDNWLVPKACAKEAEVQKLVDALNTTEGFEDWLVVSVNILDRHWQTIKAAIQHGNNQVSINLKVQAATLPNLLEREVRQVVVPQARVLSKEEIADIQRELDQQKEMHAALKEATTTKRDQLMPQMARRFDKEIVGVKARIDYLELTLTDDAITKEKQQGKEAPKDESQEGGEVKPPEAETNPPMTLKEKLAAQKAEREAGK